MARLKIATYNINGIRARLGALLEWLEREKPDVACLQELKAPDEAFPLSDIAALGYGAIWHGQKSWNGVAILARGAQPELRRRGLPDDPDGSQSRYLEADVHGLRVACLYLPNGNPWPGPKFEYKLAWFAQLQRRAAKLLKERVPAVVCGDFNVVPTDELDIYNPASWRKDALLQPESREAWFALLAQGWVDSIRAVHGDARIYTFWDYFRKHWERDAGLRIDHLLLSPQLAPMLADAGVDRWVRGRHGASDHAPTWVELEARGGTSRGRGRTASRTRGAAGRDRADAETRLTAGSDSDGEVTGEREVAARRAATASARKAGSASKNASAGRSGSAREAVAKKTAARSKSTRVRKEVPLAERAKSSDAAAPRKQSSKKAGARKSTTRGRVTKTAAPTPAPKRSRAAGKKSAK